MRVSQAHLILMVGALTWLLTACTDTAAPTPATVPTTTTQSARPTEVPTAVQEVTQAAPINISSSAVAVSPDGSLVAAVNPDSDSVTLVTVDSLTVLREVPVDE